MSDIDEKLRKILQTPHQDSLGAAVMSFSTQGTLDKIKQAFADEGYVHVTASQETQAAIANTILGHKVMTGQEWYERFKAEYHNKADWIAGDPDMGEDAEHDVLLAARLASGISEE